ncbi:hypothetical protein GCM10009555_106310 [Acrocarpospora macrocephala]|uniref:Uncharacterized protein n=1 Tax=Acrocarpospora macrocephala TaxID=150177 RepID=A0A5M3X0S9_9ACTN|nr:hypothetical protein Amac_089720 [Acrocarpospora macrocephala]
MAAVAVAATGAVSVNDPTNPNALKNPGNPQNLRDLVDLEHPQTPAHPAGLYDHGLRTPSGSRRYGLWVPSSGSRGHG